MGISKIQEDRGIDKIMATKILGHEIFNEQNGSTKEKLENGQTRPLRNYSKEIGAAWEVANKIGVTLLPTSEGWFALIGAEAQWKSPAEFVEYLAKGNFVNSGAAVSPDGPMAICLAALRWIQHHESKQEINSETLN